LWKRLQDYYSKRFIRVNYECWVNKQISRFFQESGRISMTNIPVSPAESPEIEAPPPLSVVELMKEQAILRSISFTQD
jgi:hypothetical protein